MKDNCIGAYQEYVGGVGEHAHQKMDKHNVHNNCYAWIDKKGALHRSNQHNCFSGLSSLSIRAGKMDALLIQIQDKIAVQYIAMSDKNMHLYYEWLFNYSNLRHAFINKNASDVLKDRVVVLDVDQDARIVICAANAVRMMWEAFSGEEYQLGQKIKIWCDMVEMGVDPTIAFPLCHTMIKKPDGYVVANAWGNGHEFLNNNTYEHINFISSNLQLEGSTFNQLGGFEGFGELYRDGEVAGQFNIHSFVSQRWGKQKKWTNPFSAPVMGTSFLNRDTFLGTLKEISTDYTSKLKELEINVV